MNQRRSQDPQEYELISNTKTLTLEDRRYLLHYAATWRKRRAFGWLTMLAAIWIIVSLICLTFMPVGMRIVPLALLTGYLAAVNIIAWIEVARGIHLRLGL